MKKQEKIVEEFTGHWSEAVQQEMLAWIRTKRVAYSKGNPRVKIRFSKKLLPKGRVECRKAQQEFRNRVNADSGITDFRMEVSQDSDAHRVYFFPGGSPGLVEKIKKLFSTINPSEEDGDDDDDADSDASLSMQDLQDALGEAIQAAFNEALEELEFRRGMDKNIYCWVFSIQVTLSDPENQEGRKLLQWLKEAPEGTKRWICELLRGDEMGAYFEFAEFDGLILQETGPRNAEERQNLQNADSQRFQIKPNFECRQGRPVSKAPDESSPSVSSAPERTSVWRLTDAQGEREVRISLLRPQALGREADILVDGKFTSKRHGKLWFDLGDWYYQDIDSSNGSRIIRSGQTIAVFPGKKAQSDRFGPVLLEPGDRIVFAATKAGEPADFPVLEYPPDTGTRGTRTPLADARPMPTPIALTPGPILARLCLPDGSRRDLDQSCLPYSMGREHNQSCQIPEKYTYTAKVSGKHLEILSIDAQGACIHMVGRHGGSLAGQPVRKDARLLWPWGETLVLGIVPDQGEPYALVLERPSHDD